MARLLVETMSTGALVAAGTSGALGAPNAGAAKSARSCVVKSCCELGFLARWRRVINGGVELHRVVGLGRLGIACERLVCCGDPGCVIIGCVGCVGRLDGCARIIGSFRRR